MPPQAVSNPTRRFVLTRLVGGVETNLRVGGLLPNGFTTDATERAPMLAASRQAKADNPGVVFRLYSPTNGGAHTDDDCVWDSRVKQ